ncbi:MAG: class I SAM-dependent methyltransferase [Candidatus Omnitrophota bacterium]
MNDNRELFEKWAGGVNGRYNREQWMLSKWENIEGIEWPEDKIRIMTGNILSSLQLSKEMSLADLGCGGGWILDRLANGARFSVGLDFSKEMLNQARQVYKERFFVCADICQIPFAAGSFDRAISYFVFNNFMDDAMVKKAVENIVRILKKGGLALIGQLPDKSKSGEYDAAKAVYLEHWRRERPLGRNLRDEMRFPQKLYDLDVLRRMLDGFPITYDLVPSFNPFYFTGQPVTVSWRVDAVIKKNY